MHVIIISSTRCRFFIPGSFVEIFTFESLLLVNIMERPAESLISFTDNRKEFYLLSKSDGDNGLEILISDLNSSWQQQGKLR